MVVTGVYTLVDYVQQTNARIINTVRVTEQADEAGAFLRAYAQNAEAIYADDIMAGSGCLTLERRRQDTILGLWHSGERFYIRDADFGEFSGNDNSNNLGLVLVPLTQTGRNWNSYGAIDGSVQYSLYLNDESPILDFKDINIRPTDPNRSADGSWHSLRSPCQPTT